MDKLQEPGAIIANKLLQDELTKLREELNTIKSREEALLLSARFNDIANREYQEQLREELEAERSDNLQLREILAITEGSHASRRPKSEGEK